MDGETLVVVGMGYVGIPAAALFADAPGVSVVGLQRRSARSGWKIDLLNEGRSPFPETEPGIAELIERVVKEKKSFRVTDDLDEVRNATTVLIDVQTPVEDDHHPRYESLIEVANEIGERIRPGTLVCVESTVAPGTTHHVVLRALEKRSGLKVGKDFNLAFSYERVMVGRLLHNIRSYPRIVGGTTPECGLRAQRLYQRIVSAAIVVTDSLTAEVAKTVENAYRDVNIAFANEVALACESLGVNVFEVRKLVNNLPNDQSNPLQNPVRNMHVPGAGVGGHCLPKDSWLLIHGLSEYGKMKVPTPIMETARMVNSNMPLHVADLVEQILAEAGVALSEAKVAMLGYAFLPDSDDTRNTPSEPLRAELLRRGVRDLRIHDPFVRAEELPSVMRDLEEAVAGADCICVVTAHTEYLNIDTARLRSAIRRPLIVDGRNVFAVAPNGFVMKSVGK